MRLAGQRIGLARWCGAPSGRGRRGREAAGGCIAGVAILSGECLHAASSRAIIPGRPTFPCRLRRPARNRSPLIARSKKLASRGRISGLFRGIEHMMRWSLSLMWPCQHIGGVRIRSPLLHAQRRRSRLVAAPLGPGGETIAREGVPCGRARVTGIEHREGCDQGLLSSRSRRRRPVHQDEGPRSTSSLGPR